MSEALTVAGPQTLQRTSDWGGAAERGLQARKEREQIIGRVLKEGLDFGVIPGTQKPTLLKAGAEKIADCLSLYPDYDVVGRTEDFDKPLFVYTYRCLLKQRGSDTVIATGIGSCNSMESRYRWRGGKRRCPKCQSDAIIKGKAEYGGGWLCFAKRGGCGAKFDDDDKAIVGQSVERVLNDDIADQVNTIDKMAQKRALVAASLNLGFSEQFTQDMEDLAHEEPAYEPPRTATQPKPQSVPSTQSSDAEPVWRGKMKEMTTKAGETKGKKWELYMFVGHDGERFGTFDTKIRDGLLSLDGHFVEVVYESTARGGKNIVEYRDVSTEEVGL